MGFYRLFRPIIVRGQNRDLYRFEITPELLASVKFTLNNLIIYNFNVSNEPVRKRKMLSGAVVTAHFIQLRIEFPVGGYSAEEFDMVARFRGNATEAS
jgi:hypothetical protein